MVALLNNYHACLACEQALSRGAGGLLAGYTCVYKVSRNVTRKVTDLCSVEQNNRDHETFLSTRTSNTGSTPAFVTCLMSVLYYGYAVCCFDGFFFIFPISRIMTFFKTTWAMLFQCYVQRLFSADEHIVLFEENTPRNPDFDYDRFELADMENSECKSKLHFKNWSARASWSSESSSKILLLSEIKRRKSQRCTWDGHLKNKRETNITS